MNKTQLHNKHTDLKAKMAEFAGYDMPIQYPDGVLNEHNWTRSSAGLFDVSHMGQIILEGDGVISLLEKLTPSSYSALKFEKAKYTVLTNEEGGIIDDLIVTRMDENKFFCVVNAGCKDKDIAWIKKHCPDNITFTELTNRSLVALQGPEAERVLKETFNIDTASLGYMNMMETDDLFVSRLGYTGEDGFEISMLSEKAEEIWDKLINHDAVKPIGLAARDSLRLEMGYPLYGHDIDDTTSPVEADIQWIMGKRENHGFIGTERVLKELESGAPRKRVGIKLTDKGIAREGTKIMDSHNKEIGVITSGTFSPTLKQAVAMGYVDSTLSDTGTPITLEVRGRNIAAEIVDLPFVSAKTKMLKKKKAA